MPLALVAAAVAWFALIELVASFPLPRALYVGVGAVGCVAIASWGARGSTRRPKVMVLFVAALASLHLGPWSSRKIFIAKFRTIEPGMDVGAVDTVLGTYAFRESRASSGYMERAYRHVDQGRYDSDVGVVTLRDDRVVSTQFLPD